MRGFFASILAIGAFVAAGAAAAFFVDAASRTCAVSEQTSEVAAGAPRLEKSTAEPGDTTIEATLLVPSFLSAVNQCSGSLPAVSFGQRVWLRDLPDGEVIGGVIAQTHLGSDTAGTARLDLKAPESIAAGAVDIAPVMLHAEEITQAGKYEGDFVLVSGGDTSPAIHVSVLVQDLFVWPFLALIAGASFAWFLLRSADYERPRELLRAELRGAGETYKRFVARQNGCPYKLAKAFPRGKKWKADERSEYLAEKLLFKIRDARTQIELDDASKNVTDLAERVAMLPKLCVQLAELAESLPTLDAAVKETLAKHPDLKPDLPPPPAIQKATSDLLTKKPELTTADEAAAFLTHLRQQADAVDSWVQAWRYLDTVLASWKEARRLPAQDRAELDKLDSPAAIATVYMWRPAKWADVRKANVVERLEVVHVAAESAVRKGRPIAVAELEVPAGLPGRLTETRTRAQILAAVEARDIIEFVITFLITTFAFLLTLYVGKNFGGSPWDYVSAFVAGATGQLAINWKLLPWYRSYAATRTAA